MYTVFSKISNDPLKEPMFFGNHVNISRFDQQKYSIFETLTEKQLSFFWRPEEIDISKDRIDYQSLKLYEKKIFIRNLQYQILLDSIQSRSPNCAFLPIVSLPEVENWIETWSFSETIHSRSYTYIIRNIIDDPSLIFDKIVSNQEIIDRAKDISFYYDHLIQLIRLYQTFGEGIHKIHEKKVTVSLRELKKSLYLCLISVNALESIRFYVSFACSFAFAEKELMEGNAKIIKLIARDEALHVTGTQHMINIMQSSKEDKEMIEISKECLMICQKIFLNVSDQEKRWADYLFSNGNLIGLNKKILKEYIDYITEVRMRAIGLKKDLIKKINPIPWINAWLSSDNIQSAPQETEVSSYLVGQVDTKVDLNKLSNFEL
ncbi:class Ia ribonucleoside-diphosphate reductase subunit beta [Candidatus Riesia pediculicola]|uniref:ribonucleoside-diphosphate reductase n=1 Tax=Riesia pediculicola (strain USDA) TaxID=515618 RepID=D4G7N3_RIEPU|nr:class Ia ribonucleoside-diphosphate reductase subunit beta [Candidatus Riesia pediculicola]ADD79418.1 ribonucleoside-diphosphate reductase, beta subunit [Candidatus Riesia pediculicola USDA]ARC53609.1 ribonucleotide-diphosphate reductase subunit beta [Candidatus Riesia pediculicola]QOJ86261.1 ribonucleotide-diphosphate reductase subunit beta [Candidatus Riesia pediculicola]